MPNNTSNIVPVFATANDEFYRGERHRSLPIPETMTHVPDYPAKLRIYKIAASPFWQMRCYFKGKTYTKTTQTTSKRTAFVKARDFFHSKVAELYGVAVQLTTEREVVFADLVDPTLAMQQGRVDRGELSQKHLQMLRNRLHRYVVPALGQVPIQDFGYQHGADYMQKLSAKGSSSVTIQQYLVSIRKVLTHAMATGYIKVVPKLPNITIKSNPRGSFS